MELVLWPIAILTGAGLACAGLVVGAARLGRGEDRHAAAYSAAIHAAVITAAIGLLLGWPAIPPADALQWLVYLPLLALSAGLLEAWNTPAALRWLLRAVVMVVATRVIVVDWAYYAEERKWWWIATAGIIAANWFGARYRASRLLPLPTLLGTAAAFALAGGLGLLSRNVKLAQAGSAGCAATAGLLVAAWWLGSRRAWTLAGLAPTLAVLFPALGMYGYFYNEGEVPTFAFLLLAAAPLGLLLQHLPLVTRRPGWQRFVLVALLTVLPAGVAAGTGWVCDLQATDTTADGGYGY